MPRTSTRAVRDAPAPDLDFTHDPGVEEARERAEAARRAGVSPVALRGGGAIHVGTAGWTDRTLTAAGVFYPRGARTAEDRLRYYASLFSMVEVDSSYYALPSRRSAELWALRTPAGFTFDIKAHASMTGQPAEVRRLPRSIRDELPREAAGKERIYPKDLPPALEDELWRTYLDAIEPLREAGKLGVVLLQYPRWFVPSRENEEALVEARERLGAIPAAVELRNARWLDDRRRDRTLALLERHRLSFVMVDAPAGLPSSMPPVAAVTSPDLAVLRLHGRRAVTWEERGVTVAERYRYLYDEEEIEEWTAPILDVARKVRRVHVVFNNCFGNYAVANALELREKLRQAAALPGLERAG
jgi:uncharacterized protein YecE (DUF72 family)